MRWESLAGKLFTENLLYTAWPDYFKYCCYSYCVSERRELLYQWFRSTCYSTLTCDSCFTTTTAPRSFYSNSSSSSMRWDWQWLIEWPSSGGQVCDLWCRRYCIFVSDNFHKRSVNPASISSYLGIHFLCCLLTLTTAQMRCIPKTNRSIAGTRCQCSSVRGKTKWLNPSQMSFQSSQYMIGFGVDNPYLRSMIGAR